MPWYCIISITPGSVSESLEGSVFASERMESTETIVPDGASEEQRSPRGHNPRRHLREDEPDCHEYHTARLEPARPMDPIRITSSFWGQNLE